MHHTHKRRYLQKRSKATIRAKICIKERKESFEAKQSFKQIKNQNNEKINTQSYLHNSGW